MYKNKYIIQFFLYIAYAVILAHGIIPHHHHDNNFCTCSANIEITDHQSDHKHICDSEEHDIEITSNCSCEFDEHTDIHFCNFKSEIFHNNVGFLDVFFAQADSEIISIALESVRILTESEQNYNSIYFLISSKRGPPVC